MSFPVDAVVNFLIDVYAQPVWVRLWTVWMFVVIFAVPVVMRKHGAARRDYLLVASSTATLIVAVPLWHSHVGYVRLVGFPHIPVWTPLAVYLFVRRKHLSSPRQLRWAANVFMATIIVSLAFDYVDAVRYLLGERAPVNIPAAG